MKMTYLKKKQLIPPRRQESSHRRDAKTELKKKRLFLMYTTLVTPTAVMWKWVPDPGTMFELTKYTVKLMGLLKRQMKNRLQIIS